MDAILLGTVIIVRQNNDLRYLKDMLHGEPRNGHTGAQKLILLFINIGSCSAHIGYLSAPNSIRHEHRITECTPCALSARKWDMYVCRHVQAFAQHYAAHHGSSMPRK